jgi:hypothetical protein
MATEPRAAPLSRENLMLMAEVMVRFRHAGASHRNIARLFGWSKSAFYRTVAAPLDRIVSQLGQDEAENTQIINEWVSQLGQVEIARRKRRPSLPREGEAARLMAGLAGLDRLTNRDPADIVAQMPPGMREEALQLAERIARWLAKVGRQ